MSQAVYHSAYDSLVVPSEMIKGIYHQATDVGGIPLAFNQQHLVRVLVQIRRKR